MIDVSLHPKRLFLDRVNKLDLIITNNSPSPCTDIVLKLNVPTHMLNTKGNGRIVIRELKAGQRIQQELSILPKREGTWTISGSNFSYRDSLNRPKRVTDLELDLQIVPPPQEDPSPEPEISLEVDTKQLILGQWAILSGYVNNVGRLPIHNVKVSANGLVRVDRFQPLVNIGSLAPGQTREFKLGIQVNEPGAEVPIHIDATFSDDRGHSITKSKSIHVQVSEPPAPIPPNIEPTFIIEKVINMRDNYQQHQGVQGPNARADHSTFNQIVNQNLVEIDVQQLTAELSRLAEYMKANAREPEHFTDVGVIASAERAAREGDKPSAIEHLRKGGKWAFDTARLIGVDLVATILTKQMGI